MAVLATFRKEDPNEQGKDEDPTSPSISPRRILLTSLEFECEEYLREVTFGLVRNCDRFGRFEAEGKVV